MLVIVGDVDPKATLAKVKNAVRRASSRRSCRPIRKIEFAPQKAASFTLETDRPNATAIVAMRLPGLDSPDFPALEVLSDVLSSERFDLYGLVPAGKALERRLLARSAAESVARLMPRSRSPPAATPRPRRTKSARSWAR